MSKVTLRAHRRRRNAALPPAHRVGNYLRGSLRGLAEAARRTSTRSSPSPRSSMLSRNRLEEALAGHPGRAPPHYASSLGTRLAHALEPAGLPTVERLAGPLDVFHFSDWMYPRQRGGAALDDRPRPHPAALPEWVHPRTRRQNLAKYAHAARTCDVIVTISSFTADDIAERLGFPRERIVVAYPGVDERFTPEGPRRDRRLRAHARARTIPAKNHAALASAVELVRSRRPELRLRRRPTTCRTTSCRVSTAALPSSPTRPSSRASGSRSSRRWRAGRPSSPPRIRRWTRPPATRRCGSTREPRGDRGGHRARPQRAGALVAQGLEHARRFTWRACGEAHLQGFDTTL